MEIDFLNFDWWLHVRNEFKPSREFCTIKDLSYNKENMNRKTKADVLEEEVAKLQEELEERLMDNNCDM